MNLLTRLLSKYKYFLIAFVLLAPPIGLETFIRISIISSKNQISQGDGITMHPYDWAFRFGGKIGLEDLKLQSNIQQNKFRREEIEDTIKLIESDKFTEMLKEEIDNGTLEGIEIPNRNLLWRIMARYILLRNIL